MKKILFLILIAISFTGCCFDISNFGYLKPNQWDSKSIPDKRNCGADENTTFRIITDTCEIAPGVTLTYRTDTKQFNFNYKSNKNLPNFVTIRDCDFTAHDFVTAGMSSYTGTKHVIFENCKFSQFTNDAVPINSTGKVHFTFNKCSFSGNVNNSHITLNNCKIGGFTSDGMNPLREFFANNLYVYDLEHEANLKGAHIDGVQIYGDQRSRNNEINGKWYTKVDTGNIHYNNVRFEIPSIHFDETNKSYVNSSFMFQLEFSGVDNVSFKNIYVNGGGKWYPIYMDHGKNNNKCPTGQYWSHRNVRVQNVMVSNNYGKIFYPDLLEDISIENVYHHNYMFITSVWKDASGTVHFLATNDTNEDKNFVVKTNIGTYNFFIPHHPSNWALGGEIDTKTNPKESLTDLNGRAYTTYTWADLPIDVEYTIPGNPSFIVCYQNDEQIRYVSFDGRNHHVSEIK